MSYRRSEILVGLFILAGVIVILFGIFTIRGYAVGTTRPYHSFYRNVNTITQGSAVKYNGMMVGRVQDVRVDPEQPDRIRVDYDVLDDESIRITDAMHAKITKADLLGDEYIDIRVTGASEGSPEALAAGGADLPAGSTIPAGEPFDLQRALEDLQGAIGKVDDLLADASSQVSAALAKMNEILDDAHDLVSPENRAQVEAAIADVAATASDLKGLLGDNKARVDAIFSSVGNAAGNLEQVSGDVAETVTELRPDLEELTGDLQRAVRTLEAALSDASAAVDGLDVEQVNEVVENLDTASRNLAEFTREIKERPYRLIRKEKRPPKEFK